MVVSTARVRRVLPRRVPAPVSVPGIALCAAMLPTFASPLRAQQLLEGLTAATARVTASTSQALHTTAGLVTFDSGNVVLAPPGQAPQTLLTLTGTLFGSFLLQTDQNQVLFGHTGVGPTGSTDRLWLVPLAGPAPTQPLAAVPFNYDAVMLTPTTVLVSARTGGFAVAVNDLVVVDLSTGAAQIVASLPGASGPVAVAANGDVFYATSSPAFPAPTGTVQVLRFPRPAFDAAIVSQTVLGIVDAQVIWSGLDTASDFAFDDDGDLLFVDWMNARVSELSDANGAPSLVPVVVDYATAPTSPSTVQFVPGAAVGQFEPFQPPNGRLLVFESDFWSTSQLRTVATAPAALAVSGGATIAAGPFAIVATGGPGFGVGVVAFAFGHGGPPVVAGVPGFEQLVWLAPAVLNGGPILVPVAFDAAGAVSLVPTNPGFAPALAATTQVVFVSATGVLGATNHVEITIGQ